ncbi:hypothetical protein L249_8139 [Ophiocordyceps polyrhachis-furcata BCC 54312]|uniref:AB hydrolase-1 domain-containing protein n=1 Tax=Ophiocordyceps polyrhachis-furcata BCC 54312 TaxID=1330021 RepID=A0A367LHV1_9HYPO|nr:hypothetical protein L249_8139 [Ophiocordyceps polyrhachis-furcata BCC 54312]
MMGTPALLRVAPSRLSRKSIRVICCVTKSARAALHTTCVKTPGGLAYDLHEPTAKPQEIGSQPPIIFLHGLFGSKRNNQSICNNPSTVAMANSELRRVLSRDLNTRVYALDLRNHGDSFHHDDHDYSVMAEDVSAFIKDNKLGDVTIIGHSMGAKTAMNLALREPDLVANLISVDNAPVLSPINKEFSEYIRGMVEVEAAGVTNRVNADERLQQFVPSLAVRQFLLANLYRAQGSPKLRFRISLDTLQRSLGKLGEFPECDGERQPFVKPSLFIRGSKSNYIKDEMLTSIGHLFPKFRLVDVDAGHWLISEQPEAFRQEVLDFLGASTKK